MRVNRILVYVFLRDDTNCALVRQCNVKRRARKIELFGQVCYCFFCCVRVGCLRLLPGFFIDIKKRMIQAFLFIATSIHLNKGLVDPFQHAVVVADHDAIG